MDCTHHYISPLGGITMASDGEALTGLWFDGQKRFAETLAAENEERDLPVFALADRWLDVYFSGERPDFMPPLAPRGTPFRRAVWEALLTVPYGETATYGQIAAAVAERVEFTVRHRYAERCVSFIKSLVIIRRAVCAESGAHDIVGGLTSRYDLVIE